MESKWLGRLALAGLVFTVCGSSGLISGCAEERDPINRVQQGALAKSFFLGPNLEDYKDDPEFRTKAFNIDSGANTDSAAGSIGGASAIERLRWEVTEDMLLAHRSYQESPGADNRGLPRKQDPKTGKWEFPGKATGTVVAAFKIEGHFDIRRSYNSATGEEQNVIEENTSDRPWYKREYMRVNWGQNMAESTSGDTSWVFGGGSDATSVDYSDTNENDEDRPHFEVGTGYFDITNKYQLKPSPGPYGIPECVLVGFYTGTTSFDCTPVEVKMRTSFQRLSGDEDFEPFEEDKAFRDVVGNWGNAGNNFNREYGGAPITAWDPQYGFNDANTKTFYSIHNIWEKSHTPIACNDNTDGDADGIADACASVTGSHGSQCDTIVGRCTIPVRDRKVKTNGYWLNADAPQDLTDPTDGTGKKTGDGPIEENTVTWNQMFKVAVAYRREVECRRTHDGGRDDCHAQFFTGTGPESKQMVKFGGWGMDTPTEWKTDHDDKTNADIPIVATCHNPVRGYDLPMCGKPGEVIRLGDLRKNYAIYWQYASRAPYGGVASIGGDPITGEMLGVTATIMMRSATYAAAQQRDIIALANGDLKVDDLIQGVQASNYASHIKDGKVVDGMTQAATPAQLEQAVKNLDHKAIQIAVGEDPTSQAKLSPMDRQIKAANTRMKESLMSGGVAKANQQLEDLMKVLSSSTAAPLSRELANRGLYKLVDQSADKSTAVYNAIKTFAAQDPNRMQDVLDSYQASLGNRGICFVDNIQAAGAGSIYQASLAPYFKKLYGDLDPIARGVKVYQDLLRESVKGIAFHEIGHSLGLRHNFGSSWDALNYTPQYWQLRTNEGKSTKVCEQPRQGGADDCMGPRYMDPLSDDEQGIGGEARPGIEYFGNTSTMEYQIERFGETVGAGTYDLHAMKTLYGRVLETFDTAQVKESEQQLFAVKTLSQGISKDLILDTAKGYGLHYTQGAIKAKVFDANRDCRQATDDEKASAKWRVVHGKICSQSPKNHLAYEDMKSLPISFKIQGQTIPIGADGVRWKGIDYEPGNHPLVRWQYRYAEDYSKGGYIHGKATDSGADVYEITMNVIRRFDATYPWSYFRRQNKEFAWWSIPSGIANNTFARMRAYHWSTTTDIGRASDTDLADDNQERPAVMASAEMFKFLQRSILHPEPGNYGVGADSVRRTAARSGAQPILDVLTDTEAKEVGATVGALGIVDGRFVQVDFDNTLGGSWDYAHYPSHAGFDEEKALALRELVDSRPTLSTVSRDNALDGRDPYISFRTDTPKAIDRLLGGVLSEDWEAVAPSLSSDGQTSVTLDLLNPDPASIKRDGTKGILFPNIGYSNQIATGIYGLIYSRFSTDMVMANKLRIRAVGDAGAQMDNPVTFHDPVSGITYQAQRYGMETIAGRPVETGIASRMLLRANELASTAWEGAMGGDGVFTPSGTSGAPGIKDAAADQVIRRYIGLLDGMRQVGNIYGGGPLGGGGGGGGDE